MYITFDIMDPEWRQYAQQSDEEEKSNYAGWYNNR